MSRESEARHLVDHAELSILGCRPVQATPQEQQFWHANGAPGLVDSPHDNSVKALCFDCHREVWVGPQQQALRSERPHEVLVLDLFCAAKRTVKADAADIAVDIFALGTRHPDDAPFH